MKNRNRLAVLISLLLCAAMFIVAGCPGSGATTPSTSTTSTTGTGTVFTTHVPGGTPTPTTTPTPSTTTTVPTTRTTVSTTPATSTTPTTSTRPTTSTTTTPATTPAGTGQTAGQLAAIGGGVFSDSCAGCHGSGGQGVTAPAVIGPNAQLGKYGTAQGLNSFIKANMPLNAPGSLADLQYLQVTAYLLLQNNYVNANTPLSQSNLGTITLNRT